MNRYISTKEKTVGISNRMMQKLLYMRIQIGKTLLNPITFHHPTFFCGGRRRRASRGKKGKKKKSPSLLANATILTQMNHNNIF